MNTDYSRADFRASKMKWESTLDQRGSGYFDALWERGDCILVLNAPQYV